MDTITSNVQLRKAQIIQNINLSISGGGETVTEQISVVEMQERISKGEKFHTKEAIQRFVADAKGKITKSYQEDDKKRLQGQIDSELSLLKAVRVQTGTGQVLDFFTQGLPESK